jgi:hypothetical protein
MDLFGLGSMSLELSLCLDLNLSTSLDSSVQQIHSYLCNLMEDAIRPLGCSPRRTNNSCVIIMANAQKQQRKHCITTSRSIHIPCTVEDSGTLDNWDLIGRAVASVRIEPGRKPWNNRVTTSNFIDQMIACYILKASFVGPCFSPLIYGLQISVSNQYMVLLAITLRRGKTSRRLK